MARVLDAPARETLSLPVVQSPLNMHVNDRYGSPLALIMGFFIYLFIFLVW